MPDLLIHSMSEFLSLILPCMEAAGSRKVVEIGSEFGGTSKALGDWLGERGGSLICVDPSPQAGFTAWANATKNVRHLQYASLEVINALTDADTWLVDGDHNYYTVLEELRAIFRRPGTQGGSGPLAFLHDVGWPCSRRDFYYAPERVPASARHPYSYEAGVRPGNPGCVPGRGLRGMGTIAIALREGGLRNGVLTAVEDFLREASADGLDLIWHFVPGVFGLGIIHPRGASWGPTVQQILAPWHNNPLLASLEANRLANYLAVIEWQDTR